MGLLKNIQWAGGSSDTIVHKFDMKNDYVSRGSALTVRESQACVFCHKGKMADVFLPGFYKLDTDSIPVLTKLMSWKYGFENPFRSDIYFVSTKQFTEKWGTLTPIIVRDKDYGAVRIRGYGTYSFRVQDPFVFLQELSGTNSSFRTQEITEYLKSFVISGITDAIGESKIPVLDMAANILELGQMVQKSINSRFTDIGLELAQFNFQNFSLPEELEKALDKSASLGMMRGGMDTYLRMAQADAMVEAAKNPGTAGTAIGAGLGLGIGANLGGAFGGMYNNSAASQPAAANKVACAKCGYMMKSDAKFCPECGTPAGAVCPSCGAKVSPTAKFCPECGKPLAKKCPKCGAAIKANAKFCPECGEKI